MIHNIDETVFVAKEDEFIVKAHARGVKQF